MHAALDALVRLGEGVAVLEAAASSRSLELIATDMLVFDGMRYALWALTPFSGPSSPTRAARRMAALRGRACAAAETLHGVVLQQFRAHAPAVAVGDKRADAVRTSRTVCSVGAALGDDVRAELIGARVAAFRAAFAVDDGGLGAVERRFAWLRKELLSIWKALGAAHDRDWGVVFPTQ